jgi:CheY-like chemotaxis protein
MLNKILCVDDDQITLMLCKKVIERSTFANEIITLQNGEEAFNYFKDLSVEIANKIDVDYPKLVFLDLNMPIIDGWEFLDSYLANKFHEVFSTNFIVLSSTIDPLDYMKSKTYPFVIDFIAKPITKEILETLKERF